MDMCFVFWEIGGVKLNSKLDISMGIVFWKC